MDWVWQSTPSVAKLMKLTYPPTCIFTMCFLPPASVLVIHPWQSILDNWISPIRWRSVTPKKTPKNETQFSKRVLRKKNHAGSMANLTNLPVSPYLTVPDRNVLWKLEISHSTFTLTFHPLNLTQPLMYKSLEAVVPRDIAYNAPRDLHTCKQSPQPTHKQRLSPLAPRSDLHELQCI